MQRNISLFSDTLPFGSGEWPPWWKPIEMGETTTMMMIITCEWKRDPLIVLWLFVMKNEKLHRRSKNGRIWDDGNTPFAPSKNTPLPPNSLKKTD